jgi:hypothetical protein
MHIDTISRKQEVEHPYLTGKRYCYCYCDGGTTVGDPYGYANHYSMEHDRLSVLWTAEELAAFRPEDTVHGFRIRLDQELKDEIAHLKKKARRAPTHYQGRLICTRVGQYPPKKVWEHEGINVKQMLLDRIEFLKNNRIDFVEITYVDKAQGTAMYY